MSDIELRSTDIASAQERQLTNCDLCDIRPGHRVMSASGVEGVICAECDERSGK